MHWNDQQSFLFHSEKQQQQPNDKDFESYWLKQNHMPGGDRVYTAYVEWFQLASDSINMNSDEMLKFKMNLWEFFWPEENCVWNQHELEFMISPQG